WNPGISSMFPPKQERSLSAFGFRGRTGRKERRRSSKAHPQASAFVVFWSSNTCGEAESAVPFLEVVVLCRPNGAKGILPCWNFGGTITATAFVDAPFAGKEKAIRPW